MEKGINLKHIGGNFDINREADAVALAAVFMGGDLLDHSGNYLFGHVVRVVANTWMLVEQYPDDFDRLSISPREAAVVAALHDTIEDCDIDLIDLENLGLEARLVAAVDGITHRKGETYLDYICRCVDDPISAFVKSADVLDNTSPGRTQLLPDDIRERFRKKYNRAKHILVHTTGFDPF